MTPPAIALSATLAFLLATPCFAQARTEYLKAMPPPGELPYRKVVYVDDGKCPEGQVKEVTGGSVGRSIPRTVKCVKRPD